MKVIIAALCVTFLGSIAAGCGDKSGNSGGVAPVSSGNPVRTSQPRIATTAFPSGQVGVAYNFQLAATGGVPPYNWGVQSNSPLPSGLNINASTGVVSGFPTAAGTYSVGVVLGDSPDSNNGVGSHATTLSLVIAP